MKTTVSMYILLVVLLPATGYGAAASKVQQEVTHTLKGKTSTLNLRIEDQDVEQKKLRVSDAPACSYKDQLIRYVATYDGSLAMQWTCLYVRDKESKDDKESKHSDGFLEKVHGFRVRSYLDDKDKLFDEEVAPKNTFSASVQSVQEDKLELFQIRCKDATYDKFAEQMIATGLPEYVRDVIGEIEKWLKDEKAGFFTACTCQINDNWIQLYFGTTEGRIYFVYLDDTKDTIEPHPVDKGPLVDDTSAIQDLDFLRKADGSLDSTSISYISHKLIAVIAELVQNSQHALVQVDNDQAVKQLHELRSDESKGRGVLTTVCTPQAMFVLVGLEGRSLMLIDCTSKDKFEIPYAGDVPHHFDGLSWLDVPDDKKLLILCSHLGMRLSKVDLHLSALQMISVALLKREHAQDDLAGKLIEEFLELCLSSKERQFALKNEPSKEKGKEDPAKTVSVRQLLEARDTQNASILHKAVSGGFEKLVADLIAPEVVDKADLLNLLRSQAGEQKVTVMHEAVMQGQVGILEQLFRTDFDADEREQLVNCEDKDGNNLLGVAVNLSDELAEKVNDILFAQLENATVEAS